MQKKKQSFKKHLMILLTLLVALAMPVTAQAASKKVSLKVSGRTVYVGASKSLGVKATKGAKVTFKSSNKAIVTVNSKGVVTGKKTGTAKVTVTAKKSKYKTAKKTVTIKVVKRNNSITASNKSVEVGKTVSLGAKAKGGSLSYKSSNTKIATVNSKGVITGKKVGSCKITISTKGNSKYKAMNKSITLKVTKKQVSQPVNNVTEVTKTAHYRCSCGSSFDTPEERLKHINTGNEYQKSHLHYQTIKCDVADTTAKFITIVPAYAETIKKGDYYWVCGNGAGCEEKFGSSLGLDMHQSTPFLWGNFSHPSNHTVLKNRLKDFVVEHPAVGYMSDSQWAPEEDDPYTKYVCGCGLEFPTKTDWWYHAWAMGLNFNWETGVGWSMEPYIESANHGDDGVYYYGLDDF